MRMMMISEQRQGGPNCQKRTSSSLLPKWKNKKPFFCWQRSDNNTCTKFSFATTTTITSCQRGGSEKKLCFFVHHIGKNMGDGNNIEGEKVTATKNWFETKTVASSTSLPTIWEETLITCLATPTKRWFKTKTVLLCPPRCQSSLIKLP